MFFWIFISFFAWTILSIVYFFNKVGYKNEKISKTRHYFEMIFGIPVLIIVNFVGWIANG